jgi:hypothetical protein
MKKHLLLIGVAGAAALMLSSCAAMLSGTTQQISFNSEPQGATVGVNGQILCATPCIADVQRNSTAIATFKKDSYKREEVILSSTINPMTFFNILCGGVFGLVIDGLTGAMWQYSFPSVHVKLTPENGYAPQPQAQERLSDKLKVAVLAPTAAAEVSEELKAIVLIELSSAVANAFGYTLLESGQVDSVLAESKAAPADEKQAGALGQKVGADKVLLTHVSKLGDAYHLSCRLVDVATARIDSQKTGKTVSGGDNIDDVVIDMVVSMLRQY